MASTNSSSSAAGNLRRRKNANEAPSRPTSTAQTAPVTHQQQNVQRQRAPPRPGNRKDIPKWKVAIIGLLWISFMIFMNPFVAPRLIYGILNAQSGGPPCHGETCHIDPTNFNRQCGPSSDPSRVLFMHMPKTGGTTLRKEFTRVAPHKGVSVHDIGEIEDLVPSIPIPDLKREVLGYHNPDPMWKARRISKYYKSAYNILTYPPNAHKYNRTFFHGHFYYHGDWTEALRMTPQPNWHRFFPSKLRNFLKLNRPRRSDLTLGDGLEVITMLRKPKDRLKSMYYYDRLIARSDNWRLDYLAHSGNETLEECLLNETCVEVNELRRWCSVQTEMLCGGPSKAECRTQPLGRSALEIAKDNLKNGVLFAGTTDRMEDSLALLEKLLPTYLEGIPLYSSSSNAPRERSSPVVQESAFSEEATKVLDDLCQLDEELYQYASALLTERLSMCLQR